MVNNGKHIALIFRFRLIVTVQVLDCRYTEGPRDSNVQQSTRSCACLLQHVDRFRGILV